MPTSHPDAQLVEMFRAVRQDARSDPQPTETARVFVIDITFDGAGTLPTVGQCQVLPLGMLRARVVGAVIAANGFGSATIDLRHGTMTDLPVLAQMYGVTGNIPTLTSAAAALLDTSTWTVDILPSDVLMATLTSVSSVVLVPPAMGALTCLTLSLYCRHLKWPAGGSTLVDSNGNTLTTLSGANVTLRSFP